MPSPTRRTASLPVYLVGTALLLAAPSPPPAGQEEPLEAPGEAQRVRVELVQVYATVVNRDGRPVTDLTAEDFVVTEDGDPMEIEVFEPPYSLAARAVPERPAAAEPPGEPAAEPAPPEEAAAPPPPQRTPRTYAAVFDGHNNPSGIRFRAARDATIRFVEERMHPDDRMAVIELRPQLNVLIDLTSDRERLVSALKSVTFMPTGKSGVAALIESTVEDTAFRSGDTATERLVNLARFNEVVERAGQRIFYDNLTAVGQGLARLPGRKYLLLYSGGFPFLQATQQIYAYADYFPFSFRNMLDEMARSNTAIYSLNVGDESFGADVEQAGNLRLSLARVGMDENILEHIGLSQAYFGEDPFYTKQSLAILAGETGGRFVNVGDYDLALQSIDVELEAAYTLGYYPKRSVDDGGYRRIGVKVKGRPRLEVQHRTGYFAPKPYRGMIEEERRLALNKAAAGHTDRRDLTLGTDVGFLPAPGGNSVAAVVIDVPLRELQVQPRGAERAFALDVVLVARDGSGEVVDSISKQVQAVLNPSKMPPEHGGLRMVESLTLPPGVGDIRLVVRDHASGATSTQDLSLQVPDYRYKRLMVTSLYLMTESSDHAVVDMDFVDAATRQRLAQEARQRDPDAPTPPPPPQNNPFRLGEGGTFRPTPQARFDPSEDLLVYFQAVNLQHSEEANGPVLSVTFDLKDRETGKVRVPERQELVVLDGGQGRPATIVYRLGLGEVPAGAYDLRVTVLDKVAQTAAQGARPLSFTEPAIASTTP